MTTWNNEYMYMDSASPDPNKLIKEILTKSPTPLIPETITDFNINNNISPFIKSNSIDINSKHTSTNCLQDINIEIQNKFHNNQSQTIYPSIKNAFSSKIESTNYTSSNNTTNEYKPILQTNVNKSNKQTNHSTIKTDDNTHFSCILPSISPSISPKFPSYPPSYYISNPLSNNNCNTNNILMEKPKNIKKETRIYAFEQKAMECIRCNEAFVTHNQWKTHMVYVHKTNAKQIFNSKDIDYHDQQTDTKYASTLGLNNTDININIKRD
eukprot:263894_1